jgi:small subunit ribosomal protein S6
LEVLGLKTIAKKLYEAMFLVDSAQATSDWDEVETNIKNILEKAEAEIISIKKWEERRLAYEIDGKDKGTYVLCYFRADGKRNQDIERAVQLTEQIMRVLILCAEGRDKEIEEDTPAVPAENKEQEAAKATVKESGGPEQPAENKSVETMGVDAGPEQPREGKIDSEQADEQENEKSKGEEISE